MSPPRHHRSTVFGTTWHRSANWATVSITSWCPAFGPPPTARSRAARSSPSSNSVALSPLGPPVGVRSTSSTRDTGSRSTKSVPQPQFIEPPPSTRHRGHQREHHPDYRGRGHRHSPMIGRKNRRPTNRRSRASPRYVAAAHTVAFERPADGTAPAQPSPTAAVSSASDVRRTRGREPTARVAGRTSPSLNSPASGSRATATAQHPRNHPRRQPRTKPTHLPRGRSPSRFPNHPTTP
jgi:hypothetical protein